MRRGLLLLALLVFVGHAFAQSNPLDSSYKPAMDCTVGDYPSNVRLSGDMDKLMQTTSSPSALASATVCGTFYGTQNEWVDFQLHTRAPVGGYTGVSISISSFSKTTGPGGSYTIPNTYRSIIPYKEAYLNIPGTYTAPYGFPSAHSGNVAYIISGSTGGQVPDPLIPFVDPYYDQTTNANPANVAANNNQSWWFDILIPAAAPSGWYAGTVTIQTGCPGACATLATMPVDIGVWQWPVAHGGEMPSTPTLPFYANATNEDTAPACLQYFGSISSCGSFPGSGGNSTVGLALSENQLAILFLDHRQSWGRELDPATNTPASGTWNTYWPWLATAGAPPAGDPAPILSGAKDQAMVFYGTGIANPGAQNWLTLFSGLAGANLSYEPAFYAADEPGTTCSGGAGSKSWGAAVAAAGVVHADTPAGQVLITGNIHDATACNATLGVAVPNDVDIFVVATSGSNGAGTTDPNMDPNFADQGPGGNPCTITTYPYCLDRAAYNSWLAGASNRRLASYFGCTNVGTCNNGTQGFSALDSYYNVNADGTGVSNRAQEWFTYLHSQTAELYFSDIQCWWNDDGGCLAGGSGGSPPGPDPWKSIYHFGNNGDGTTIYPSTSGSTNHILTSGGAALATPFPVPSIRLELRRDGIQDYEYLNLIGNVYGASRCPGSTVCSTWVTNEILTWGDAAFDFNNNPVAAGSGSHSSFTGDITDARTAIGNQMQAITYSGSIPPTLPPLNLGVTVSNKK